MFRCYSKVFRCYSKVFRCYSKVFRCYSKVFRCYSKTPVLKAVLTPLLLNTGKKCRNIHLSQ